MKHTHNHCCDHGHDHGPAGDPTPNPFGGEMDAGQKSLTDALRLSFGILKVIMLAVVALFLASGIFNVDPNEKALVLTFGKVRGTGETRVKGPGLHWTFPEPISEIVRIPVERVQSLSLDSFWYNESAQEKMTGQRIVTSPDLDPLVEGYSLTRNEGNLDLEGTDYNIVHSDWTVSYRIEQPEFFFENVYMRSREPGEDFLDAAAESVDPLIRSLASDAVVTTMVHYSIDDAIKSNTDIANDVRDLLQRKLDGIESGIRVVEVRAKRITWPKQVDDAFQASNQARQASEQIRINAAAYRQKLLTDTAGPRATEVLEKLEAGGLTAEDREALLVDMAGQVQSVIAAARADRTEVVEDAKAMASYLKNLLPEYRKYPQLVIQQLYQDAIEQVLANAEEKILVPPTQTGENREIRVQINRDPKLKKQQTNSEDRK